MVRIYLVLLTLCFLQCTASPQLPYNTINVATVIEDLKAGADIYILLPVEHAGEMF